MKKGWKLALIVLTTLLVLILVVPFLIPVPPLKGLQTPQMLADADSQFIEINGLQVHYKRMGEDEPFFILLHGFGASTFSWREVITPLSTYGTVIAYDRPAFGLTERPLDWNGKNPYTQESNLSLLLGLLDAFDIKQAILIGNSAGGTLATAFTLKHPERVQALIEVDAAIYQTMPASPLLNWLLQTPQIDHLGPLIARRLAGSQGDVFLETAWHDPSRIESDPDIKAGYQKPLLVENWDRALWAHTQATNPPDLEGRLDHIKIPTLIISGDDDQIVPVALSRQLAIEIPGARLEIIPNCGHLPQGECPEEFMEIMNNFLQSVLEENYE